jgi:hypothetical protein
MAMELFLRSFTLLAAINFNQSCKSTGVPFGDSAAFAEREIPGTVSPTSIAGLLARLEVIKAQDLTEVIEAAEDLSWHLKQLAALNEKTIPPLMVGADNLLSAARSLYELQLLEQLEAGVPLVQGEWQNITRFDQSMIRQEIQSALQDFQPNADFALGLRRLIELPTDDRALANLEEIATAWQKLHDPTLLSTWEIYRLLVDASAGLALARDQECKDTAQYIQTVSQLRRAAVEAQSIELLPDVVEGIAMRHLRFRHKGMTEASIDVRDEVAARSKALNDQIIATAKPGNVTLCSRRLFMSEGSNLAHHATGN